MNRLALVLVFLLACDSPAPSPGTTGSASNRAQDLPSLASNAPADQVVEGDHSTEPEYLRLIDEARKQLPSVRTRFLGGLPAEHHLFVTTVLLTPTTREQLFVSVRDWSNPDQIDGLIASEPTSPGFREGDVIKVRQSDIIDWTIARPDGSEEGNVLGKYLETHH